MIYLVTSCVIASLQNAGATDGAPTGERPSLGERPDRSGRTASDIGARHSPRGAAARPLPAGSASGEGGGHVSGELSPNVISIGYELTCRDIESAVADIIEITRRTVSRVKAEEARNAREAMPSDSRWPE